MKLNKEENKMKVEVKFIIETEDYGAGEFRKEIETLIENIDPDTKLLTFNMKEIEK